MRWIYKLIEKSGRFYIYAYARESEVLDGVISYDTKNSKITVAKPCSKDIGKKYGVEKAIEHFQHVIDEGFPEERHVDCG